MDNKNGEMDMSCFLLIEDSGDSEMDSGPMQQSDDQSMEIATAGGGVTDDKDDAESCSCDDLSSTERLDNDFYQVILQLDQVKQDNKFTYRIEPAGTGSSSSCSSSSSSSSNMWSIGEDLGRHISADHDNQAEDPQEARFGIKLCREVMDGMEDRLFWETCIAVGYPSL